MNAALLLRLHAHFTCTYMHCTRMLQHPNPTLPALPTPLQSPHAVGGTQEVLAAPLLHTDCRNSTLATVAPGTVCHVGPHLLINHCAWRAQGVSSCQHPVGVGALCWCLLFSSKGLITTDVRPPLSRLSRMVRGLGGLPSPPGSIRIKQVWRVSRDKGTTAMAAAVHLRFPLLLPHAALTSLCQLPCFCM